MHDADSETYITFRKDSTQASCLFNLSQNTIRIRIFFFFLGGGNINSIKTKSER